MFTIFDIVNNILLYRALHVFFFGMCVLASDRTTAAKKHFLEELKFRQIHFRDIRCAVRFTPPLSLPQSHNRRVSPFLFPSFNYPPISHVLISFLTGFRF